MVSLREETLQAIVPCHKANLSDLHLGDFNGDLESRDGKRVLYDCKRGTCPRHRCYRLCLRMLRSKHGTCAQDARHVTTGIHLEIAIVCATTVKGTQSGLACELNDATARAIFTSLGLERRFRLTHKGVEFQESCDLGMVGSCRNLLESCSPHDQSTP